MANRGRLTFQKREREKARLQKRKDKEVRRDEAKAKRSTVVRPAGEEDPDIAGIRPGPQPPTDEY
jgi:hypothetical protein